MAKVIGVRFRDNGKIYYFSSEQFEVEVGQNVIVETARGVEYEEWYLEIVKFMMRRLFPR